MTTSKQHRAGRHFLQIPGPSNVPDSVLRAISRPTIDHRGPDLPELTFRILEGLAPIFNTSSSIFIYPSSGTGAWECALLNTLSPGERVLAFETGHFATLWKNMAEKLGLDVRWIPGDWRHGVDPAIVEEQLSEDRNHDIKAVLALHTETSTGITSDIGAIRKAIDSAGHPALFLVDTISSLACTEFRMDDWKVDVTVSGSQKGLMLPPGLSFNAVSAKALEKSNEVTSHHSYWHWQDMLADNQKGYFPYTPATNLLYGLDQALKLLHAEGMDKVFARHARFAQATREALAAWGLENICLDPNGYSNTTTGVVVPDGHDADEVRKVILENFDMSLGTGLGKLKGKIFRIGHLGDFNELMLAGTLAGVEMGLELAGIPFNKGGINAAMNYLSTNQ